MVGFGPILVYSPPFVYYLTAINLYSLFEVRLFGGP